MAAVLPPKHGDIPEDSTRLGGWAASQPPATVCLMAVFQRNTNTFERRHTNVYVILLVSQIQQTFANPVIVNSRRKTKKKKNVVHT
jgi:hypothetical protein